MSQRFLVTRRLALLSVAAASLSPCAAWAARWPLITVHKDPNCGCCSGWVDHLKLSGFEVNAIETTAVNRVKARLRVPNELVSCHTAEVGGYVVEGHVPAAAIERLLTERPKAQGLAVPGMPSGSPGMDGEPEEYEVILFGPDGRSVYGKFKGEKQI